MTRICCAAALCWLSLYPAVMAWSPGSIHWDTKLRDDINNRERCRSRQASSIGRREPWTRSNRSISKSTRVTSSAQDGDNNGHAVVATTPDRQAGREGLKGIVTFAPPGAGDDTCYEGGCPANVEPPHGTDPKELDIPALREIRSSTAGPTVWSEFSALAAETGAVNLGQGFPNWDPPDFVVAAGQTALSQGFHQYTRTAGHPRLVQLLAERYSRHFGKEVDPFGQVAITIGASQALYVTFQAILSPGDEVILLEPFFDLYLGQIRMAGGVPRQVPLRVEDGHWKLDLDALKSAITPRTRAIVVNTPHNPTGKAFSLHELESIADVVRENPRMLIVSDEVYKYMVYAGGEPHEEAKGGTLSSISSGTDPRDADNESGRSTIEGSDLLTASKEAQTSAARPFPPPGHFHCSTLDDMWDRTITISSAGKTFSVTGWQIGWVLGPRRVINEIHTILPYMQFCASTPLQEAMCNALTEAERPYKGSFNYYDWLRNQYASKRMRLEESLSAAGIPSLRGEGGFFIIGDVSGIKVPAKYLEESTPAMPVMTHAWAFCRWLALEYGLVAIPTSPFFSAASRAKGLGNGLVRFCFCKTEETLDAAAEILAKMAAEQPARATGETGGRLQTGETHGRSDSD